MDVPFPHPLPHPPIPNPPSPFDSLVPSPSHLPQPPSTSHLPSPPPVPSFLSTSLPHPPIPPHSDSKKGPAAKVVREEAKPGIGFPVMFSRQITVTHTHTHTQRQTPGSSMGCVPLLPVKELTEGRALKLELMTFTYLSG